MTGKLKREKKEAAIFQLTAAPVYRLLFDHFQGLL
jgi:hypothetical protein